MKDRDFLIWIHERLVTLGDDPIVDFLHRLREIIYAYPADWHSFSNTKGFWVCANNIDDLKELLAVKDATVDPYIYVCS